MLGLLLCIGLNSAAAAPPTDVIDRLPGTTRLAISLRWKLLAESELARTNSEQLKELVGNVPGLLNQLAIESGRVDRIWLVAGDSFPAGAAVIFSGSIDTTRVQARLAEWSRDRWFATRTLREGTRVTFAADLPVGSLPIPGVPTTAYFGVTDELVIIATDRETLIALMAKAQTPELPKAKLPVPAIFWESAIAGVLVPPTTLAAPDAILAGVSSATLDVSVASGLMFRIRLATTNVDNLNSRLTAGTEQVQKLFGPLATQQGVEPRLIALVTEIAGKASITKSDGGVEATVTLTEDEISRKLKKQ